AKEPCACACAVGRPRRRCHAPRGYRRTARLLCPGMTARVRSLVIALASLPMCIALAACSPSPPSKATPAPQGLPGFYAVPAGVASKWPGALLKSEPVTAPEVRGRVGRLMYGVAVARVGGVGVGG